MMQAHLLRTVNADGGPEITRTSFHRVLPTVRQLLAPAHVRYSDPCIQDMQQLISRIRFKSRNVVRVGAYVLTYKPLIAALLDLIRERPSVEVRVLYDKMFCNSSITELEAIVALARAGATVKHLRSYNMHIKMVCVDNSYCWSGSGNFGEVAVTANAELNTEIEGNVVAACGIFDKYFIGRSEGDLKWHQSVQPTDCSQTVSCTQLTVCDCVLDNLPHDKVALQNGKWCETVVQMQQQQGETLLREATRPVKD
ncbi:hypothetical protein PF010_g29802, partial [Phytophthora fragariae]